MILLYILNNSRGEEMLKEDIINEEKDEYLIERMGGFDVLPEDDDEEIPED